MKARCILPARPSGRLKTSSAKVISSPCVNWRCAAPPNALTTKCAPGAIPRDRKKSGTPTMRFYCALATTPAARSWCALPHVWRQDWAVPGMRCMSKPPRYTACLNRSDGRFLTLCGWRRSSAPRRQPFQSPRRKPPSFVMPVNITWARLSLAVRKSGTGGAANVLVIAFPITRRSWICWSSASMNPRCHYRTALTIGDRLSTNGACKSAVAWWR